MANLYIYYFCFIWYVIYLELFILLNDNEKGINYFLNMN